jgi:2-polyprenyl-3-methyl-5-hydroxy-6-metoxy-1,4-benzoquinol methylase
MTLVLVPCPICGSARRRLLYAGTIPHDGTDPRTYFGSSRTSAGHLPIVQCTGCGLVMSNPQDNRETLAQVYAAHEDSAYEGEHENRRRAALQHLALVMRYHTRPARILDVGCATGIFVSAAQESGWQATGLDASEWMIAGGRRRCPAATFRVGTLDEVTFQPGEFAAITLWDVLEHVPAPLEALERMHPWLAPEGRLFLSLPNATSLMARIMGRHWVLLLREHLWYFSPVTIEKLLARAGFEMVRTRPKLVQFSLANVLGRLAQYPGPLSAAAGRLSRVSTWNRLRLRFPMGEMDVVARPK